MEGLETQPSDVVPETSTGQETPAVQPEQDKIVGDDVERKSVISEHREGEPPVDHHEDTTSNNDDNPAPAAEESNSSPSTANETWESKWINAIKEDNLEKVKEILTQDGTIDLEFDCDMPEANIDARGLTPLLLAAALGKPQILKHLIHEKANVHATTTSNASTALQLATKRGYTEVADILLDAHISIDAQTGYGDTALMLAVYFESLEMVTTLLKWYKLLKKPISTIINEDGWTALHYAGDTGNAAILEALLDYDPDVEESINKKDYRNRTPLYLACIQGDVGCVKLLLGKNANVKVRDTWDRTPLHAAAYYENFSVIEELLKWTTAEDWNMMQSDGSTPLHIAAEERARSIVDILVSDGRTDITIRDKHRNTVLAIFAARYWTDLILRLLKQTPYFPEMPTEVTAILATETERSDVESSLRWHLEKSSSEEVKDDLEVIMYWAVLNGQTRLAEICIDKGQDVLSWKRGEATWLHVAAIKGDRTMIEKLIEKGVDIRTKGKGDVTALHMVTKSGYEGVLKLFLRKIWEEAHQGEDADHEARHVSTHENGQPLQDDPDVTNYVELTQIILVRTSKDESMLSLAIHGRSSDHREIEKVLWKILILCSQKIPNFLSHLESQAEEATQLLELAAQSERRGQKAFLIDLLKSKRGPDEMESKDWTTLHWAIYHGYPVVVWWLLANGGHLNGEEKSLGSTIASKRKDNALEIERGKTQNYKWIMNLLRNPPPILENEAFLDEDDLPQLLNLDMDDKMQGSIVDFYKKGLEVDLQIHQSSVKQILYGEGPQSIMSIVAKEDIRQLKNLRERMKEVPTKSTDENTADRNKRTGDSKQERKKDPSDKNASNESAMAITPGNFQFRWLHIPINDMDCVQELMTKIALDANRKVKDHRPLANFVRRSWTELVAGGRKRYMKPQCVHRDTILYTSGDSTHEKNSVSQGVTNDDDWGRLRREENRNKNQKDASKIPGLALYMPYLSWGENHTKTGEEKAVEQDDQAQKATLQEKSVHSNALMELLSSSTDPTENAERRAKVLHQPHKPMTLDQYYYASLDDTSSRDNSQVVSRYFVRERQKEKEARIEAEKAKDEENREKGRGNAKEKDSREIAGKFETQNRNFLYKYRGVPESNSIIDDTDNQILMVDQLWLWIIDDKTIITSTTKQTKEYDDGVLQKIVSYLVDSSIRGLSRPESVQLMMKLAISIAIEFLRDNKIKVAENKMKSPLEIFQESIRYVSSRETALFETFEGYLRDDQARTIQVKRIALDSSDKNQDTNPYYDIREEMNLLREIKDICDELNILKNLYEDQELVWKQAFKVPFVDQESFASKAYPPTELKEELEELIAEAIEVQRAINTLLDLKQKQANIAEAKDARMQSEQSARQNDTIMVFTVVTIIFTPMTFLTSLFALNVSDYPHESGSVVYRGWWIFPIIFGVSTVVATVFISFAFNASWIRDILERRRLYKQKKEAERLKIDSFLMFSTRHHGPLETWTTRIGESSKSKLEYLSGRLKKRHKAASDIEQQRVNGVGNEQEIYKNTEKATVVETRSSSGGSEPSQPREP